MNRWLALLTLTLLLACGHKKKDSTENYFSAISFLKVQVKQMDTTRYIYTKIESVGTVSDTTVISNQEFKKYANDFLTLPDISSDENYDDYEESNSYDDDLKIVLLTYSPKNNEAEIRRQTVMLEPNEFGESKVRTILINTITVQKNVTIEKEMTWHVNKRLLIVTKTTMDNKPETMKTVLIRWE